MPTLTVEYLGRCLRAFAAAFDASEQEARIFADCHVRADLRAHHTQGLQIIPIVYDFLIHGTERFGVEPKVVNEGQNFAVIDSGKEVGVVAATRAMDVAIGKAKESGIACVWVKNAGVFDMAANYAMQALPHRQIGIAAENGIPFVAPWGGRDPFFSTNPLAVAIPSQGEIPIVIDMSAGSYSAGNVLAARKAGQRMPAPHLVDGDGHYTDDPQRLKMTPPSHEISSGAIVTQGARGFAWSILIEVFAGLLSGMSASFENSGKLEEKGKQQFGQFFMAVDVAAVTDFEQFSDAVDRFIVALKVARPAVGFDEVMVPGERAARYERHRMRHGIPIRSDDWKAFLRIAGEIGLEVQDPSQAE